ncbi:hypothetical protein AAEX28_15795 [Lentisphaerota bacterium WC36G]|nr:hypothetical protein LJT99_02560 [Lentisphaerae bacterium WC36]
MKIPFAINDTNDIVFVDDVPRGKACGCRCPLCKEPLMARKGDINAHHFAHIGNFSCKQKALIRFFAIEFILKKLQKSLQSEEKFKVSWHCDICYETHEGDILKVAKGVAKAEKESNHTPDIHLLDESNRPIIAIQIATSNRIKKGIIDYCNENKLPLFKVTVKDINTLIEIYKGDINLELISNFCRNSKKCPKHLSCEEKCSGYGYKKELLIIERNCWKCYAKVNIAILKIKNEYHETKLFTNQDFNMAKEKGVKFYNFSHQNFYVYRCNQCDNTFRPRESFELEFYKDSSVLEKIVMGYYCEKKDFHFK